MSTVNRFYVIRTTPHENRYLSIYDDEQETLNIAEAKMFEQVSSFLIRVLEHTKLNYPEARLGAVDFTVSDVDMDSIMAALEAEQDEDPSDEDNDEDLPIHEQNVSAEALDLLDAGIADIKEGRVVSIFVNDLVTTEE